MTSRFSERAARIEGTEQEGQILIDFSSGLAGQQQIRRLVGCERSFLCSQSNGAAPWRHQPKHGWETRAWLRNENSSVNAGCLQYPRRIRWSCQPLDHPPSLSTSSSITCSHSFHSFLFFHRRTVHRERNSHYLLLLASKTTMFLLGAFRLVGNRLAEYSSLSTVPRLNFKKVLGRRHSP